MFSASFQQFTIESLMASSALRGGLTALNKCKHHDKGSFYSAFFQLSVGLERFFKIIYVVQYMIENDLKKPSSKQLRLIGHDINSLHQNAVSVALKYKIKDEAKWILNDEQSKILTMLSEFGRETRYYNLNTIVEDKKAMNDPLEQWGEILENCYWKYISLIKREELQKNTFAWAERNRIYGFTSSFGLDGQIMTHVDQYLLNWKIIKISPYISWEIISMLQPYYSLLISLRDAIQLKEKEKRIREPLVPYFHEIFPYFLLDKARAKRRKNWLL